MLVLDILDCESVEESLEDHTPLYILAVHAPLLPTSLISALLTDTSTGESVISSTPWTYSVDVSHARIRAPG